MNNITEQVLSAIDVVVDQALSSLQFDKTISAEINNIINLDTGEYKVLYLGNTFSAFDSSLTGDYEVGDNVYVTVPQGDFSQRKVIIGKTKNSSLSYSEMVSLTNSISETSPTFDGIYDYDPSVEYGVVAGAPVDSELSTAVIYTGVDDDSVNATFKKYAEQNTLIKIQGSFLTQFHSEHNTGNYGLQIEFYTSGGNTVYYKLDLSSFLGDPYSLSVYSPQSAIISIQAGQLTGISSIFLFEENFEYDEYISAGIGTGNYNTDTANIFVKDISIQFVESRDLTSSTTYYLDISMPKGNCFTSSITSLDLTGRLIYQGSNIISSSNCECYWYERDLSVVIGSENYDKKAGVGWKAIADDYEGLNYNTLTVNTSEVIYEKYYKLVVIYNETTTLEAEGTLYQVNSAYDIDLAQTTEEDEIILSITDSFLVGDWYMQYPDTSYTQIASQTNSIEVSGLLLYSPVVFYCGIYDTEQLEVVAVRSLTITTPESEEDLTITYVGEDIFRYDSNGDIDITSSEQERTLQAILTWAEGCGSSYTLEWIGPDGETITGTRYSPEKSMMENLWVDTSNILHYTIRQKYKVNYANNTIQIKITTLDGIEYNYYKEFLFLKDGDQGTNGTTYVAAIRPYDTSTGLKTAGLHSLIYRDGAWQNTLPLKCFVYKDGESINNDSDFELEFKWTGFNIDVADGTDDSCKIISGTDAITASSAPYIKAQISIDDQTNGREYDIYCYYPIDVSFGFEDDEIDLIDIDGIPSYIKYNSSGTNPSFYSDSIAFLYDEADYTSQVTSLTTDILVIRQYSYSEGYYLKPASSFIFENNSIAMLNCQYTSDKYLYHPIIMYLDTYGNEAINGWDGTTLELNEEGGYILAPQIGAGSKDSANRFTGVVMGQDSEQSKVGLYGYQAGISTFGLMEDGTAYFGAVNTGGRITIDGTEGVITGGEGGESANGMTITLANLETAKDPAKVEAIKLGGGTFIVTYDGSLVASSAEISGEINALTGVIGGWTIDGNTLTAGSGSSTVVLDANSSSSSNAIWCGANSEANAKFSVSKAGDIYAISGTIGGWTLASTYLTSTKNTNGYGKIGMASTGNSAFWAGIVSNPTSFPPAESKDAAFLVTPDGKLYASSAEIEGKVTATSGTVGGWSIEDNLLYSGSSSSYVGLNSNTSTSAYAIWCGNKTASSADFSVTRAGVVKMNSAQIAGSSSFYGKLAIYSSSSVLGGYMYYMSGSQSNINGSVTSTIGVGFIDSSSTNYCVATTAGAKLGNSNGEIYILTNGTIGFSNQVYILGSGSEAQCNVTSPDNVYSGRFLVNTSGNLGIYDTATSPNAWVIRKDLEAGNAIYVGVTGNTIYLAGTAYASSDRRLKRDIQDLDNKYCLMLDYMEPVSFIYKADKENKVVAGYIAQEVEEAAQIVGLDVENMGIVSRDDSDSLHLNYLEIIPMLHLKIKQQEERIKNLESLLN